MNIGVVLLANNGEFRYKIATKRQRVTRFFETLEHKVYLRARNEVEDEFNRLVGFFASQKVRSAYSPALSSTLSILAKR